MNIVILSRNPSLYSTQALIDAASKRGHSVRVIDHMMCDLLIEEGKSAVYYNFEKLNDVSAIIPRIGTTATSYGALVIRQFENLGIFTTLNAEALLNSRNKLVSMQMLVNEGIKVPKTGISNNLLTKSALIDKIGKPPYILKLATGTQGLGVILSETKQNAESILEAFMKTEEKVMVQEFIEEVKGADVRVFIIDGKIVGVMKRQAKEGEFRSNIHRGAQSAAIKLTKEEEKVALKAAKIMGLDIAGVDLLQTKNGPMILEVNASPGLEGIEATTQIDIATKMIQFIEKKIGKNVKR
jgi:ribosomal protein S6--L-glutamate ligase